MEDKNKSIINELLLEQDYYLLHKHPSKFSKLKIKKFREIIKKRNGK